MVGIQAFDLLENEIDITPWLSLLCDGSHHNFSLQVVGEKEQQPGSYWIVTGKVFVWVDDDNQMTTGPAPQVTVDPVSLNASGGGDKGGPILYQQSITRSITQLNIVGQKETYASNQRFSMENKGNITNGGNDQWTQYTKANQPPPATRHCTFMLASDIHPRWKSHQQWRRKTLSSRPRISNRAWT